VIGQFVNRFRFIVRVPSQTRWYRAAACCVFFACGTALAQDPSEIFRVTDRPEFVQPREALRRLAVAKHATGRNDFCVFARLPPNGRIAAWVHWRQHHELILWQPGGDGVDKLADAVRVLDLTRDVVATRKDVAGSSYLVTRAWVDDTLRTCRRMGQHFTIYVSRPRGVAGSGTSTGK
jgi:hypothetical protein